MERSGRWNHSLRTSPLFFKSLKNLTLIALLWYAWPKLVAQPAQPPYPTVVSTVDPYTERLQAWIGGPYSDEARRKEAVKRIIPFLLSQDSSNTYTPEELITQETTKAFLRQPNAPAEDYVNFCLRRGLFDEQREKYDQQIIDFYGTFWYNRREAYQLHQLFAYTLYEKSGKITLISPDFSTLLEQLCDYYGIPLAEVMEQLGEHYKSLFTIPDTTWRRTPGPEDYRTGITEEKKGWVTITRYDWKSAATLLEEIGCTIRSTAEQQRETGENYEHYRTCLEGLTEETLQWIKLLKTTLQDLSGRPEDKAFTLVINGGTERGHLGDRTTIIGKSLGKPVWHTRQHGWGSTVDLRLSGEEAVRLAKFFPNKSGTCYISDEVGNKYRFDYLRHGTWINRHRHLHITRVK